LSEIVILIDGVIDNAITIGIALDCGTGILIDTGVDSA
jgi:hypothetical protein